MEDDFFDPYEDPDHVRQVMEIVAHNTKGEDDCYCTYNTTCSYCARKL